MKVGIVGFGFVGQAQYSIINNKEDIFIYDKYIDEYKENKLFEFKPDIIFCCLPTPTLDDGEQDLTPMKEFFDYIYSKRGWYPLVVMKSTILYDKLVLSNYDNLVYNPEFLNANTSFEDVAKQEVVILGGRIDLVSKVQKFYMNQTSISPEFELMSIKEACDFKYTRNLYGAYKVLFWEMIQDVTGNSRKMSELYHKMGYQSEMSQVSMDGYRGYGGACFPKDVKAIAKNSNHTLIQAMDNYNETLQESGWM